MSLLLAVPERQHSSADQILPRAETKAQAWPLRFAPLFDVSGVTLRYKTEHHLVTATYRVSFNVQPADRFVVLGPSGCGTSTLLKAIGGSMTPTEGTIKLKGSAIRKPGPDRVMVFQEFDPTATWKIAKKTVTFALQTSGKLRGGARFAEIADLDGHVANSHKVAP